MEENKNIIAPDNDALMKKRDDYVTILMDVLHNDNTSAEVQGVLKSSDDPFVTVPQAMLTVNDIAASRIEQSGGRVDQDTVLAASGYLLSDVVELGIAMKQFEPVDEETQKEIYSDALQMYVERGLSDSSIDPIELQLAAEKVMSTNQKVGGHSLAEQNGLGAAPSDVQMVDQLSSKKTNKVLASEAKKGALQRQANSRQQKQEQIQQQQPQGAI